MDVCLFVKDVNKKKRDFDPTIHHYKELLDKHDINFVTEVFEFLYFPCFYGYKE